MDKDKLIGMQFPANGCEAVRVTMNREKGEPPVVQVKLLDAEDEVLQLYAVAIKTPRNTLSGGKPAIYYHDKENDEHHRIVVGSEPTERVEGAPAWRIIRLED